MNQIFVWVLGWGELGLGLALFVVLALACEAGFRVGRRHAGAGRDPAAAAVMTAGMLSLLAFMLGLTLNFAQTRFEARRDLMVAEANAISTAWLHARLVGGANGEAMAGLIREYGQTRLDFARAHFSGPVDALNARASAEQVRIWDLATAVARAAPTPISAALVGSVDEMFDLAQSQRFAFLGEAPGNLLDALVLASILAIGGLGFEMGLRGVRQAILTSVLLLMWAGAMVVTVDLMRPRLGAIRADERPLEWTVEEMARAPGPASPPPPHATPAP